MNFGEALHMESNWTTTENGCDALKSTGSSLLDFYGTAGSLRNASISKKSSMFEKAYQEDKLSAMKLLFYCRDIREGVGERQTFRHILKYVAMQHPEAVVKNIPLIGLFGRYDDLYSLVGTPVESDMWCYMKEQFETDLENMENGQSVSLLAKWIKSPDSCHNGTKTLGRLTVKNLGYGGHYIEFNKRLKALRKYIGIAEGLISTNQLDKIDYSILPGKAMMKYRNLFLAKDEERFNSFINSVNKGEKTIKSSALTPYDIIHDYIKGHELGLIHGNSNIAVNDVLEGAWKSLDDYVVDKDFLVVCDTSGSMFKSWHRPAKEQSRPAEVALSLAIYSAEHNKGQFNNKFITFSSNPEIQEIEGKTLIEKIANLSTADWDNNTNLMLALQKILDIGIEYKIADKDMPSSLVIVSDMQFDSSHTGMRQAITDITKQMFEEAGYSVPNLIYWNVEAERPVFHSRKNDYGVQLASGCSPAILKQVLNAVNMTAFEAMMEVLNSERYSLVQV